VPNSAVHARSFRETLSEAGIIDDLAKRAPPIPIFDAVRYAIETAFGPRPWLDLGEILSRKN
jgi:hypothetical protein